MQEHIVCGQQYPYSVHKRKNFQMLSRKDQVYKAVLNVDAARARPCEIANQFSVKWGSLKTTSFDEFQLPIAFFGA